MYSEEGVIPDKNAHRFLRGPAKPATGDTYSDERSRQQILNAAKLAVLTPNVSLIWNPPGA